MAVATWASGFLLGGLAGWLVTSISANGTINRLRQKLSLFTDEENDEECDFDGVKAANPSAKNIVYLRLTDDSVKVLLNSLVQETPVTTIYEEDDMASSAGSVHPVETAPEPQAEPAKASEMEQLFGQVVQETAQRKAAAGAPGAPEPAPRTGYATLGQLEKKGKVKNVEGTLKRSEELEIINNFRGLVNKKFKDAVEEARKQGFSLRILYVSTKDVRDGSGTYDKQCLGVRVRKPDFPVLGESRDEYFVTEIVEVGGVDVHNRGVINL
jgi:hypothetical protein